MVLGNLWLALPLTEPVFSDCESGEASCVWFQIFQTSGVKAFFFFFCKKVGHQCECGSPVIFWRAKSHCLECEHLSSDRDYLKVFVSFFLADKAIPGRSMSMSRKSSDAKFSDISCWYIRGHRISSQKPSGMNKIILVSLKPTISPSPPPPPPPEMNKIVFVSLGFCKLLRCPPKEAYCFTEAAQSYLQMVFGHLHNFSLSCDRCCKTDAGSARATFCHQGEKKRNWPVQGFITRRGLSCFTSFFSVSCVCSTQPNMRSMQSRTNVIILIGILLARIKSSCYHWTCTFPRLSPSLQLASTH